MKNITTVILAAGRSTRFISNKSKLTHELAGYPIINHVFDSAKKVSGKNIIVVCNKDNFEELKNVLSGCKFVIQKNQRGTADAIEVAKKHIKTCKINVYKFTSFPVDDNSNVASRCHKMNPR